MVAISHSNTPPSEIACLSPAGRPRHTIDLARTVPENRAERYKGFQRKALATGRLAAKVIANGS